MHVLPEDTRQSFPCTNDMTNQQMEGSTKVVTSKMGGNVAHNMNNGEASFSPTRNKQQKSNEIHLMKAWTFTK